MQLELDITRKSIKSPKGEDSKADSKDKLMTFGRSDIYFNDITGFAMHNCSFYQCNECKNPYFGGMQDCGQAMQAENKMKKE